MINSGLDTHSPGFPFGLGVVRNRSKDCFFSMVILRKRFIWTNPLILYQRDETAMCVVLKRPYAILSNLPVFGTLDSIKPFRLFYGFRIPLCLSEDQHGDYVPHVDDIPMTRNNLEMIKATKR